MSAHKCPTCDRWVRRGKVLRCGRCRSLEVHLVTYLRAGIDNCGFVARAIADAGVRQEVFDAHV